MTFILKNKKNIQLCIARAGNVIGGGDWALGRIVPDCMRQWSSGKILKIRNPNSTRPWQHVLDVLNGYMTLAIKLKKNRNLNAETFNFGPKKEKKREVINIVKEMSSIWKKGKWKIQRDRNLKESNLLQLNSRKAKLKIGWVCKLNLKNTIKLTALWYKKYYSDKKNIFQFSLAQIKTFESIKK
jgi:CDP-glucose 4,6-dehydratase